MVTERGYCWNPGWKTVELSLIAQTDPQLQRLLTRRAFRRCIAPGANGRAYPGIRREPHTSASVNGIKIQPLETVRWTCHSNYNVASTGDGPHVSGYPNRVPAPTPALP